jgi:CBS domain-containing protein
MNVRDIMTTNPTTVRPETGLAEAGQLLLSQHLAALLVTDADDHLLGIITDGDLLRRPELGTAPAIGWWRGFLTPETAANQFIKTRGRHVSEVMTETLVSVDLDTPLIDAVERMQASRIKQLPVLRGTKLVGLLTRRNVLAALLDRLAADGDTTISDDAITTLIRTAISRSNWAPKDMVRVIADHGTVTLSGPVFSDAERRALIVIAENTSGVTHVNDQMIFVDSTSGVAFGSF